MKALTQVSREEFFRVLYADPRDIMPSISGSRFPYSSDWKTKSGELFGVSKDSTQNNGATIETTYFLNR